MQTQNTYSKSLPNNKVRNSLPPKKSVAKAPKPTMQRKVMMSSSRRQQAYTIVDQLTALVGSLKEKKKSIGYVVNDIRKLLWTVHTKRMFKAYDYDDIFTFIEEKLLYDRTYLFRLHQASMQEDEWGLEIGTCTTGVLKKVAQKGTPQLVKDRTIEIARNAAVDGIIDTGIMRVAIKQAFDEEEAIQEEKKAKAAEKSLNNNAKPSYSNTHIAELEVKRINKAYPDKGNEIISLLMRDVLENNISGDKRRYFQQQIKLFAKAAFGKNATTELNNIFENLTVASNK
jgi:hypothetical protein